MIIRLMAVDPQPRADSQTDIVVYQLPENSREFELLTALLDQSKIEWTVLKTPRKPKEMKP